METPEIKHIGKHGKQHDCIENWLGKHNRKFELLRTITSLIGALASTVVLLKMFGFI